MNLTQWKGDGVADEQDSVRLEIEVGSLPRPKAGEIIALIDECELFELPDRLPFELPDRLPPGGFHQTDPLDYRRLVTDDTRAHQVDWNDNSAVPDALRRLTEALSEFDGLAAVPWHNWHDRLR